MTPIKRRIPPVALILVFSLAVLLWPLTGCEGAQTVQGGEPHYVTFQFMGMEQQEAVSAQLPTLVDEVKERFGANPAGSQRYVGFTPGLLLSMNWPAEVLKSRVVQALDLAEETGLPVFFHLDDRHFWYDRTDLHADPDNVEWSAFPKEGETHGPIVPRYWLNWGEWRVFPAPPPCLESPKLRADVEHRLKQNVAAPIAKRLEQWREEGRAHLFAGIAVGNETEVEPFDMRGLKAIPEGHEPVGTDPTKNPPVEIKMGRDEMVQGGYCALYMRGHTAESIARLAEQQGKSVDKVKAELLHEVAHDYAEFRSKVLFDAGIPKERIYTHLTSLQGDGARARVEAGATQGLRHAGLDRYPLIRHAANSYSRPGFTVQRDLLDLSTVEEKIAAAREDADAEKGWAAVESYVTTGQPGRQQTQEEYESYLGSMFARGARVVNVYGWNIPEGRGIPYAAEEATGVLEAIQEWRDGKELAADWSNVWSDPNWSPSGPRDLPAKMEKLQNGLARLRQQGKDPAPVAEIMRDFQAKMQAGKGEEAEALLDQALEKVEEIEKD